MSSIRGDLRGSEHPPERRRRYGRGADRVHRDAAVRSRNSGIQRDCCQVSRWLDCRAIAQSATPCRLHADAVLRPARRPVPA